MKKISALLCLLFVFASLAACSEKSTSSAELSISIESTADSSDNSSDGSGTESTASITIPKYIVDLIGVNISSKASALGISGIETKDDGSVVYTIPISKKKEIVSSLKQSLLDYIGNSPENWPSIEKTEINDSFDHVTIVADKEKYNATTDRTMGASIYIPVITYRAFAELDTESTGEFVLGFTVIDKTDYSTIDEFRYPDDSDGKTTSAVSGDDKVSGTEYGDDNGGTQDNSSSDEINDETADETTEEQE